MKKNLKKLAALLLVIAVLASLTACGGDGGNKAVDSDTTEDGKTIINIAKCTSNLAAIDSEQVEEAINEYIADKLNIHINLTEYVIGEYSGKCNLAMANQEINLLWAASWLGAINCDNLYQANALYDITEMVKDTELYNSMPEQIWESSKYDGKNYFIPVYKESAEGYDVMFRKDLADKYHWDISAVKELKDIEPMLADLADDSDVQAPFLVQSTYLSNESFS